MKITRRNFIGTGSALAVGTTLATLSNRSIAKVKSVTKHQITKDRFDPWIELIPESMRYNVRILHGLAAKRPIMVVVKNNGYGLGQDNIAKILGNMPEVAGFAAVKTEACLSLHESAVSKPVLHMGMATDQDFYDLAANNIQLSIYGNKIRWVLDSISKKLGRSIAVHQYIDTGMSRMGIPYQKALPWMMDIAESEYIDVIGSFMGFTEDEEYDREQLRRFTELNNLANAKGINMGKLHAASSHAIYHFTDAALDMVRPGIAIYGAYPANPDTEKPLGELKVTYRLKARIVRVEQLRVGDTVSYGRNYTAEKPTWIATLPIGHSDGYPRNAVKGVKVFVGNKLYPVIGAVSASHSILEIGEEPTVKIGDVVTLVGPDHEEIHPNYISKVAGISVYDILMHLSSKLPKIII